MDKRVLRTKKLIEEAYLSLISDTPIEKITPTELCRRADINRNTFYAHYKTTAEVYENIEDSFIEEVTAYLHNSESPVDTIVKLCEMMRANNSVAKILLSSKYSCFRVLKRIYEVSHNFNFEKLSQYNEDIPDVYRRMTASFITIGAASALDTWIKDGMKEDPRQIGEFILEIARNGFNGVLYKDYT